MSRPMADERIVYIVDDDTTIRRSLEYLLKAVGFRTVSCATPLAFLHVAAGLSDGCVLLDIQMPGIDGLELQQRLFDMKVALPVIVVTAQGDVKSAVRAMKAGAVDFIEKPYGDEALVGTIESALKPAAPTDRSAEIAEAAARIAQLSPREGEVLVALTLGHSNKVIAYNLDISARTVDVHRARMMDRLAVRQFAEAVRLAALAGLATGIDRAADK
jgi:two-component system, LuxR family, response regulator FixJ